MSLKKKIVWLPYDMDTAIGINNEGQLVFDYRLEDIDHMSGGADIFNGQDSVLWTNVRAAFFSELAAMYKTLRSTGALSYAKVEQMFEEHQDKWPEAIFNEDAWFKYIDPLVEDGSGAYLSMLQGSKAEQRKWWLYNRFRYIDSKYNAGDALSDLIQLRGYAKANITVTPYADIYPSVKYGSYLVQERGTRGVATTLVCPLDSVNDTEIYIYSSSQLASVGDLSGLKVGFADFSMATRLQTIKIGDADSEYENQNLSALSLGNNVLLKSLDVRNCSGLGDTTMEGHTQTSVDISGCEIIEEVYFDGTKIQGLTLPNGGVLKKLHLPATMTNLTVMNQKAITEFVVDGSDYSAISTLRIENSSNVIPVVDILSDMSAGSRVRLIGFTMPVTSTDDVEDFYDYLDTMRGLDEHGNNVDTAQVQGTITGLGTITGAWLVQMKARYPYIDFEYEHVSSNLYYYNGSTLIHTEAITDGGNGAWTGTATKTSDAQYTYTFAGWSKTDDNTVDSDARIAVVADRSVYACFTGTLRTYTVTWKNADGTTLRTDSNVAWGTTPSWGQAMPTNSSGETAKGWSPTPSAITGNTTYTATYIPTYTVYFYNGSTLLEQHTVQQGGSATYSGSTPVKTGVDNPEEYTFTGWSPSPTNIQANTSCYAQFQEPQVWFDEEISDSWDTILTNIASGTHSYKPGNYKPLDLGAEGIVNMQIVGLNKDALAAGSGNAKTSWISKELLNTSHRMNPARSGSSGAYNEGTGTIGGWELCEMRTYLKNTIKPLIPSAVRSAIKDVTKYTRIYNTAGSAVNDVSSTEDVWLPSRREMFGAISNAETQGPIYNDGFNANADRVKSKVGASSASWWWLRSAGSNYHFYYVSTDGSNNYNYANNSGAVVLGFCI